MLGESAPISWQLTKLNVWRRSTDVAAKHWEQPRPDKLWSSNQSIGSTFQTVYFSLCKLRYCSFILMNLFCLPWPWGWPWGCNILQTEWILLLEYIARRVWLIIGRVNQLRTLTVRKLDWQWWIWQRCDQQIHTLSFWWKNIAENMYLWRKINCKLL